MTKKRKTSNSVKVWEGQSLLDPSATIMVTLTLKSLNDKTGDMVQATIVLRDEKPTSACASGADQAICGDCPQRGGGCYVNVGKSINAIWGCHERGNMDTVDLDTARDLIKGRGLRVGAYGDPAAVPAHIWEALISAADFHTGYTHQWRKAPALKGLVMASADSTEAAAEAQAAGWATFRVALPGKQNRFPGEAICPATTNDKVQCESCPVKCDGSKGKLAGRVIEAHGAGAGKFIEV